MSIQMKARIVVGVCLLFAIISGGCFSAQETADKKVSTISQQNAVNDIQGDESMQEQAVRQELEELYHVMWQAMLRKDIAALDNMHDDSFVLVHMTGMHQSKEEFLRSLRDGELNYFSEQTEHIQVEVHGDKGRMIGQSRVEAAVFGGSRSTWPLQLAFDVEKKNGRWMLLYARASTY